MTTSTEKQENCADDTSAASQIAYATSKLEQHEDESVLDWDISTRQKLYQAGFITIVLSRAQTLARPDSAITHASDISIQTLNSTEASSLSQPPSPTVELGTNFQDRDPQDHDTFTVPKLGLVVTSSLLRALFHDSPQATEVILANPHGLLKPAAIRTITKWLHQLLQSHEPRPLASLADRKSLSNLNEALDIRVAMQLLGIEHTYLTHFVPLYTASLSQRKPTVLEAKAVISHVVRKICPRVEDDAAVRALAERIVELQRKGSLDARVWEAFLQKGKNRGLLVAIQKQGDVFVGVRSVAVARRVVKEYEGDVYEVYGIVNQGQGRGGEKEQGHSVVEQLGDRRGKKVAKVLKSHISSKMTAGWGKVRRIASGGSGGGSEER